MNHVAEDIKRFSDLMTVLYYGKLRKLYNKADKAKYHILLQRLLNKVENNSIKYCIRVYESVTDSYGFSQC